MIYKEKSFLSAVVYVCNDEVQIGLFLSALIGVLESGFEKYEIICVNDASIDNSAAVIRGIAKKEGSGIVSLVNMSYRQGLEASMNAGVDLAIGDFVYEFDSIYMDYAPQLILSVYRRSLEGYDIVAASGKRRSLSSTLFYLTFNRNAHLQYELHSETFRILSRRAINRIHSMSKTIPYRKALYANCGLKMDTVFYEPDRPDAGKRSLDKRHRLTAAFDSLILFTNVAYKIATFFAAILMAATLAGGIYAIVVYLTGQPVAGFTTTLLVIAASFFGVFAILAIIIKYLSVIVDLVFSNQEYNFESVEKISKG